MGAQASAARTGSAASCILGARVCRAPAAPPLAVATMGQLHIVLRCCPCASQLDLAVAANHGLGQDGDTFAVACTTPACVWSEMCESNDGVGDGTGGLLTGGCTVESLSYAPTRFDETSTFDSERSQTRYARVTAGQTPAVERPTRHGFVEDWLSAAARPVVLLMPSVPLAPGKPFEPERHPCTATPAMCRVDADHTVLTISAEDGCSKLLALPTASIQKVTVVSEREGLSSPPVLVQYLSESSEVRWLLLSAEEPSLASRIASAMTALWLEKCCEAFSQMHSTFGRSDSREELLPKAPVPGPIALRNLTTSVCGPAKSECSALLLSPHRL
eukprot:NODE_1631_length_1099_cov_314.204981.p2 GENE.NODE_1631_length_1099_cov_314.204981~~NODE_1631_length_1099_cov_314.204981.p2  ORF type:complete len:331 (+),score=62.70 NODE_1631_length_1099_cov_314.204981:3-995(+)